MISLWGMRVAAALVPADTDPMPPEDPLPSPSSRAIPRRRLGSVTRKLIFTLAMIPLVPAISIIATSLIEEFWSSEPWSGNELRYYHLIFAVLWVSALLLIWRSLVLWTLGRKWLTAMVAVVPFVQVIHGMHWWGDADCGRGYFLRTSQHNLGIGAGTWLMVWVWWGWERLQMAEDTLKKQPMRRMSPVASRIVASIAIIPFVVGLFFVVGMALDDLWGSWNDDRVFALTYAVTAIAAVSIWLLIWRREIKDSGTGALKTAFGAVILIGAPIALIPLFTPQAPSWVEACIYWSPVVGWGIWMAWTARRWSVREGPVDPGSAPRCMSCGYLLIGLRSTRCPECGDEPTLDELWRAGAGEDV
jgi:hypothetical protein